MIKATHPKAGYFTQYIYSLKGEGEINDFDIVLESRCNGKSEEGFICEACYKSKLWDKFIYNRSFLEVKKFLSYQLGLYDDPLIWVKELKRCIKYDKDFSISYELSELISEVLEEIIDVEIPKSDLGEFISITNVFEGARIEQLNMGNGTIINHNYSNVLDQMLIDGVPKEIVEEGKELLKDADKSDSLKKISGNWIKSLPFKVMEKAGGWALKNTDKLAEYQDSLMLWINTL